MIDLTNSRAQTTIRRTARIFGNRLVFRDVSLDDAQFILSLRRDPAKSAYLSPTSPELSAQEEWIRSYQGSCGQAYFIICDSQMVPLGTVRLYNAIGDSFCWGSWIIKKDAPTYTSIESALIVYSYAIDHLKFSAAHFDVNKHNQSVWAFHERFGARRVKEGVTDFFYEIDLDKILASLKRYKKYLPNPIRVEIVD